MRKYKFFSNFDKEESWLNEMAGQGYVLSRKISGGYEFEPAKSADTVIRMDYRTFKQLSDFEDYRALFEDSGWKHVGGTKSSGYQYFKRVSREGSDDIFSDVDSKAGRYKRLSDMWVTLAATFIPIVAVLISTEQIDPGAIANPKSLYYTPGLWERTGAAFWRAFAFETPFVLFRGFIWLLIPAMIVLYLLFASKASSQYKKTQDEKPWK
jgi:hypothetical protein